MAEKSDDMIKKFVDFTKDFRTKTEGLSSEITTAFGGSMGSAIKSYTEMQTNYLNGFTGISSGAQKANGQLLESMDKNYADLKSQLHSIFETTQSKATDAMDTGANDFKKQCEDMVKKYPVLPEAAYKETLKAIVENKGKIIGQLDRQYKEVTGKLDKNFDATKKELTLPEVKTPKLPSLDMTPGLFESAKGALATAMNTVQPAINKAKEHLPGSSKNPPPPPKKSK